MEKIVAKSILANLHRFALQRGIHHKGLANKLKDETLGEQMYLDFSEFAPILESLVSKTNDTSFGLHLGEQYNLAALGIVGQIILASSTIGDAIEKSIQNFSMITNVLHFESELKGGSLYLYFTEDDDCKNKFPVAMRHLVISSIIFTFKELQFLTLESDLPKEVGIVYDAFELEEFERIFDTRVGFGARTNFIRFNSDVLNKKIVYADYELLVKLEKIACERFSQQVMKTSSFSGRIKEIIYNMLNPEPPTVKNIAKNLNMTERNLQRKLKFEGTTYSKLLTEVKKEMAIAYLKDDMSIKEIGYLLGYSEPSSFINAFKKWYGKTPLHFKSSLEM